MRNKVGVVIPSYNQGQFLEETIKSVLGQDGVELEIALVDGGSTDNSIEIIEKYKDKFKYWRSCKDEGQAAAVNEGVSELKDCEYVCWLNSDDVFLDDGLRKMVEFLDANREYSAVYTKARIINEFGVIIEDYPTCEFDRKKFSRGCFICQPASLIRKDMWDKVNGIDNSLHMCMDYDLWWKLAKVGTLGYLQEYTACSRDHANTKTNVNKSVHFCEAFKILKKHYGYIPWHWVITREIDEGRKGIILGTNVIKRLLYFKAFVKFLHNNLMHIVKGVK